MFRTSFAGIIVLSICVACAHAESNVTQALESSWQAGKKVPVVTPVFSQIVKFSFPQGFEVVYEKARGDNYIQESVPKGENINQWTQMITLTGAKNLASHPNASPEKVAGSIASRFKESCPDSFNTQALAEGQMNGHEAFVAVISCGRASMTSGQTSESVLLTVIKGTNDYYTIQWGERTAASSTPMTIDTAKWTARAKQLAPIQLCQKIPGEAAPYPSCIDPKPTKF